MTQLSQNTEAAERERGCVFSETFENNERVVSNGGTPVGTPTINFGADFNGSTDRINYADATVFNNSVLSYVFEFTPDFDYDVDLVNSFIGGDGGIDYDVFKTNNVNNNTINIKFGTTVVATVPEGAYSPYWKQNERNVLVISSESGDTNAWLNGVQILTNDASAWSPTVITDFNIGARGNNSQYFDGTMHSVKIFHTILTADDAMNYYNNSNFNYRNKASLDLTMGMAEHDMTNVQTLDRSGNGKNMQLGDGTTASTYPTKTTTRGYTFDGSNDYMTRSTNLGISDYPFTMLVWVNTTETSEDAVIDLADASEGDVNYALTINSGNGVVYARNGGGAERAGNLNVIGGWYHIVGVFASATSRKCYINGEFNIENTNSLAFNTNVDTFSVGRFGDSSPGSYYNGSLKFPKVIPLALTELQIKDIYINEKDKLNNI